MMIFYTLSMDAQKAQAMLAAVESHLPTAPLSSSMMRPDGPYRVADAPTWLIATLTHQGHAALCNAVEESFVSITLLPINQVNALDGQPLTQILIDFPWTPEFVTRTPDLIAELGPASGSLYGRCSSTRIGAALARGEGRVSPDPGFPRPVRPSIKTPGVLGWLNYWSTTTCAALDFSADDPRSALFARIVPASKQGILLQLTREALDLERPEHRATVTDIYRAFPAIDRAW